MDEFKIKGRIMDPSEIPIVSEMGFIMHIIAENGARLEVGTILFATKITATICSLMTDQQSQAR
jgi:predicted ABC-type sugar transport system permease subunit